MIPDENKEFYKRAKRRIRQKKRFYYHLVFFLVCSIFMVVINNVFGYKKETYGNWAAWVILGWFFLVTLHFINVFIKNPFFGKEWEQEQIEKLVAKQKKKVAKLEKNEHKNHDPASDNDEE